MSPSAPIAASGSPQVEVSVVIPHYGPVEPTQSLCRQLLDQQDIDLEVIVVDDASPIPMPDVVGVTVVRRAENGGFGTAVNSGIERSTGDLVLILNSDCLVEPRTLRSLVDAAAPFQPCVAAPQLVNLAGETAVSRFRWPTPLRTAFWHFRPYPRLHRYVFVRNWLNDNRPVLPVGPSPAEWVSGAAMLVPRAELEAVHGFDDAFFMYSEDVDLQYRLQQRGVPSFLFPSVVMTHIGQASTDSARIEALSLHARWEYARARGHTGRLRAALLAVGAANLVWSLAAVARGQQVNLSEQVRADIDRAFGKIY